MASLTRSLWLWIMVARIKKRELERMMRRKSVFLNLQERAFKKLIIILTLTMAAKLPIKRL